MIFTSKNNESLSCNKEEKTLKKELPETVPEKEFCSEKAKSKKNLVFCCVFLQNHHQIDLLHLLVETLFLQKSLSKTNYDLLIFTSKEFKDSIETTISRFGDFSFDVYSIACSSMFDAACARIHVFGYPKINDYEKILYLDTDILINSPLDSIFSLSISPSRIYALEEGEIGYEYWGGSAFFDFSTGPFSGCNHQKAFSSGILLFSPSVENQNLFETILADIQTRKIQPLAMDQPFIVYHSMVRNQYDNQLLKTFCENNPDPRTESKVEKIVYHFSGRMGDGDGKLVRMRNYLPHIGKLFLCRIKPTKECHQEMQQPFWGKKYSWLENSRNGRKTGEINFPFMDEEEFSSKQNQEKKKDSEEKKIDSEEKKIDLEEKKIDSEEKKIDLGEKKIKTTFGDGKWIKIENSPLYPIHKTEETPFMRVLMGGYNHIWVWNKQATFAISLREKDSQIMLVEHR